MALTRNDHYLDNEGLRQVWEKIKGTFVQQESGKGLSTNDYTTAEKNKLAGIAAGAEVNVQSDWSQTNTSADDYIKNKPSVYTKTEIDQMFAANVKYEVVSTLPSTGTEGVIYLVPSSTSATGDVYDEYMWIPAQGSGSSAVAAHFEKIGSTKSDFDNYYTKSEADTLLAAKQATLPKKGSTTKPVYTSAAGTLAECSTYAGGTKVTLNGSDKGANTASFYAPAGAGTAGQYLKSAGSGAPTWETMDTTPTASSSKAVTSGGVKTALDGKVNTADYLTDSEINAICV